MFVAKHPETRPKTSVIEKMEAKITELPEMIARAVDGVEVHL